jgi:glycosyltransferase involved in cell wall biosynthesis
MDVRLGKFLSSRFKIPHVIHIHYNVGPWLGRQTLETIRHSPNLIAVSEHVRQTALLQGIPSSNVHTVVNPFRPSANLCKEVVESLNREFGFDEDTPVVVAVGRLDPGKGHFDLIRAFDKVTKRIPDARLLICGSSTTRENHESALLQCVAELQQSSRVIFAGYRNDIPAILQRANVFCLPTELEPFGLVFLEAMQAETPVVAYYSGAVPEIVVHNLTGLLSYPHDISTLSENILSLLNNPTLAQRLGRAGKQRAITDFSPGKIVERWLDALSQKQSLPISH